jgi:hypothetical protein
MERRGYHVHRATFVDWCARVREHAEQLGDETASALAPFLSGVFPLDRIPPASFAMDNTLRGLAGTSISCPAIDDRLLGTYFDYFIRTGYLPRIGESAGHRPVAHAGVLPPQVANMETRTI